MNPTQLLQMNTDYYLRKYFLTISFLWWTILKKIECEFIIFLNAFQFYFY